MVTLTASATGLEPRMKVLLLALLITPLLVIVMPPWLPCVWRMSPEFKFKVPVFTIALVPGSSSMLPATFTVAPLAMLSVRPAKTFPTVEPKRLKVAPLATVTVPPPVQLPAEPLQVLLTALNVRLPAPPTVPPVWL